MDFLPHFPLYYNRVILVGLALLLGLIGGEVAKRTRIFPQISGYIAVGFLLGPDVLNITSASLLANLRIFVDISLGLILFELGKNLDFTWLKHDRGIIRMALTESLLTFSFVFLVMWFFRLPPLHASLAAAIAVATSPAVVMMIAHDLAAKGPVSRRTFILTSLNNLIGLLLFSMLLPLSKTGVTQDAMLQTALYRIAGSCCLAAILFAVMLGLARLVGKHKESQFVLFIGSVIFAIGGAKMLNISSMLTLFLLGVMARNFDTRHIFMEIDFEWLARIFFILLFVITGVNLHLKGLWQAPAMVFSFIAARLFGKFSGIWLFAKTSRLTHKQTWAICLALTPMAGLAIGMTNSIMDVNPDLGYQLIAVIVTAVAVMNIIGPVATQFAFVSADEASKVHGEAK